ncbi:NAD(P)-binding domain-containing protein [Pseudonocardia kujensis]|uniref:NAD(P)-binding domain-containing protein n=1 Tax=Pseudonocardia kujensis TaxID=1128675 RepID=UPI001E57ACE0|nr:NAD(P)-binding domain-containing protein [Pseudonocardia kujensis]MCE0768764.1 NAD(P)-binding domain-containing protein [Pseudonocardia kujensis]
MIHNVTGTVTGTVVVGAGQAGLAMSRCLTDRGLPHVVLERAAVADSWHSRRWDSFRLLSPNWQTRLPGWRYAGADPGGFMTGAEVARYLQDYAWSFDAPVRTGVDVRRLYRVAGGWRLTTSAGRFLARNVVVATGDLARPRVPAVAADLPARIHQLHTADYRNPEQLPPGAVLVVGAGPSGQQIALELVRTGRTVHLAVGRHKALPRRYRGHDAYCWMDRLGMLDRTVDTLPAPPGRTPNAVLTGGTRDLDVPRLAAEGVVAHGRLLGCTDGRLRFGDDLSATLAEAAGNATRFRSAVDAFVARTRMDVPPEAAPPPASVHAGAAPALDGIAAVVWATGFGRDHGWIEAPVTGVDGDIVHTRGVTAAAGLHVLGLRWQYRRSSSFLDGVGADARYLADVIAERTVERPTTVAA